MRSDSAWSKAYRAIIAPYACGASEGARKAAAAPREKRPRDSTKLARARYLVRMLRTALSAFFLLTIVGCPSSELAPFSQGLQVQSSLSFGDRGVGIEAS